LNKICSELSQSQVEDFFVPLTTRLSKADWFTSKISATGLYNVPYAKSTAPTQETLRQQFGQLVRDDAPMVRRQAANNLAKFLKEMPPDVVINEMIPLFQNLAGDDQDSVRLLTVEILIAIAEVIPKEQQASHGVLLSALRSLFDDKSWRVRYMVADRFEKVCKAWFSTGSKLIISRRLQRQSMRRWLAGIWYLHLLNCSKIPKPKYEAPSRVKFLVWWSA